MKIFVDITDLSISSSWRIFYLTSSSSSYVQYKIDKLVRTWWFGSHLTLLDFLLFLTIVLNWLELSEIVEYFKRTLFGKFLNEEGS